LPKNILRERKRKGGTPPQSRLGTIDDILGREERKISPERKQLIRRKRVFLSLGGKGGRRDVCPSSDTRGRARLKKGRQALAPIPRNKGSCRMAEDCRAMDRATFKKGKGTRSSPRENKRRGKGSCTKSTLIPPPLGKGKKATTLDSPPICALNG